MKILIAFLIGIASVAVPSPALADVEKGDKGQEVTEVQYMLRALGYTVTVDGTFGSQTDKLVRSWQRANGLVVDGIVGPATAGSLARAVRVTTPSDPGPPTNLSGCAEMSWYRQQAGLPEVFDAIGLRESGCDNGAKPTTTVARRYRGYWSVGVMHITNRYYGPGAAACGIDSEDDYYGRSPEQKAASACFAKVLYDYSGMQPWATS